MHKKEINDLVISWITISLAFSWVLSNFNILDLVTGQSGGFASFIEILPVSLIVTATGFIFHELAHRQMAKNFGAHAEYRMWPNMLLIAVAVSLFFGVVFAAPGAVYIYGPHLDRKKNGLISLAGPATNILISVIFAVLLINVGGALSQLFFLGAYINLFLGLFNLLPMGPLDGKKIFVWNPLIWATFFVPALFMFLFIRLI
ncbi:MAG: site-2 protease family protein [Candidatus Diapherotrites archaeon]